MTKETVTQKPYATHFEHLAELKDWVGKELGLSEWVEIKQDSVNQFAELTEDRQWIHIDPERSKRESPYQTTVAHGFMILSLASKFSYETFSIADVGMGLNYGLNRVRFPNATRVGALVRARVSLQNYEEKPGGGRYIINVVFELQGEEKPACVAEFIAQAYVAQ